MVLQSILLSSVDEQQVIILMMEMSQEQISDVAIVEGEIIRILRIISPELELVLFPHAKPQTSPVPPDKKHLGTPLLFIF